MNNRLTSILLAIALIGSLFLYFNKPSGHDREILRLEKENQNIRHRLDSANRVINLSLQREIALRLRYDLVNKELIKRTSEVNDWTIKYHSQRKQKTGILSDKKYDSTLNALYQGY